MLTNKEFFQELREDEEWLSAIMTKETLNGIDHELRERMAIGDVRKKNKAFEKDETHKELVKKASKSKRDLINYEYDLNNR